MLCIVRAHTHARVLHPRAHGSARPSRTVLCRTASCHARRPSDHAGLSLRRQPSRQAASGETGGSRGAGRPGRIGSPEEDTAFYAGFPLRARRPADTLDHWCCGFQVQTGCAVSSDNFTRELPARSTEREKPLSPCKVLAVQLRFSRGFSAHRKRRRGGLRILARRDRRRTRVGGAHTCCQQLPFYYQIMHSAMHYG